MAGNNGGPWGGGGGDDNNDRDRPNGGRRPGNEPQIPEFDEIVNKTKDQLRVLIGGGNGGNRTGGSGGGGAGGPQITRGTVGLGVLAAAALWAFSSFYTVRPEQQSVELFLGEFYGVGQPGLNFAPWPFITAEVVNVTQEQTIDIGSGRTGNDSGLMLTGDQNIVNIDFQVVWNITQPDRFLFNLADPEATIAAVAESSMREIIAQSQLGPILNRDRGVIADGVAEQVQRTLDSYDGGVNVIRVNLQAVEPPNEVIAVEDLDGNVTQTSPIAAFREVQAAAQERDRLQNLADAYANRVLARARGDAARVLEQAEGYRARVVNEAQGEASRFLAVLGEYSEAPEVTRQRLYLETIERVFSRVDLILLEDNGGQGSGVVPYLPLDQLRRTPNTDGGSN